MGGVCDKGTVLTMGLYCRKGVKDEVNNRETWTEESVFLSYSKIRNAILYRNSSPLHKTQGFISPS